MLPKIDDISYHQYIKKFMEWYEKSNTTPELKSFEFITPTGGVITNLFPVGTVENPILCKMNIPPPPNDKDYRWCAWCGH